METEVDLPMMDRAWLLVWFGDAFNSSRFSSYVAYEYPADCPILFVFQNAPVRVSFKNGMSASFMPEEGAGYMALLPPYGDSYPLARFDRELMKQPHRIGWRHFPPEFRKYSIPANFSTENWKNKLPP